MTGSTRRKGRQCEETRVIKISYDGLARVDGSARFGFDDTVALASISGPIEVRLAAELPSKAAFEVILRPLSNVPATEAKSLAASIRSCLQPSLILTKNPRTLVQLVIQSLNSPKSFVWQVDLTAAMINASTLALLNASSVPMRGVVSAVAVGRLPDGALVVDPDDEETKIMTGGGCFAFLFADGVGFENSNSDCVWSSWKSRTREHDETELFRARELARIGARSVYLAMKQSVESEHVKSEVASRDEESSDDDAMAI
ncbi:exosome component Rrp46 [Crassisporium funariophilum]|nr:exosome component Rrp46 [Crassisporium funariophilum]